MSKATPEQEDHRKLRFNGKSAPVKEAGPKSRVVVRIQANDDDPFNIRTYVQISVYSNAKPDVSRIGEIDLPLHHGVLLPKIAVLAGAIAEELDAAYGDNLDPGEVAKLATEGFRECVMLIRGDGKKTFSGKQFEPAG
tara:strand:- start:212 stop:625 length:414 start_codon:yes stop_codon:yes gene_type:complete